MNEERQSKQGGAFPWAPIFGAAAIGALAFIVAKRIQEAKDAGGSISLDAAMKACDRAVEALENRIEPLFAKS